MLEVRAAASNGRELMRKLLNCVAQVGVAIGVLVGSTILMGWAIGIFVYIISWPSLWIFRTF